MNLFYHPNITPEQSELIFDKDESRHITKVLRKKEGEILDVTDGKGHFYSVELVSCMPKQCMGIIKEIRAIEPLPYYLHMAVAPTKNNDRFEWFLEKATEIGVSRITPIICEHSERKVIKKDRFDRIIESAMKQSLKAYKPILDEAIPFKEFVQANQGTNSKKLIAFCGDVEKKGMNSYVSEREDVIVLIGPEGDFSYKEFESAVENNYLPTTLGNSRLRTETAAIVACHSISLLNQH
ncbi:MAG: 16S rRNA (uracil(1498)-N(3))-methyltransferase [Flavobacteriaceae bacterium]|nr:16S rRNA (uracil(1498)-N(3))-methyltransferase [Flavobacteriaceae bacterium]